MSERSKEGPGGCPHLARLPSLLPELMDYTRYLTEYDEARAEDLAQTAMLEVMGRLAAFDPNGAKGDALRALLFTTAKRRSKDMFKDDKREGTALPPDIEDYDDAGSYQEYDGFLSPDLAAALAGLSETLRNTVQTVVLGDKTHVEVAAGMGVDVNTVDQRMSRARKHLKDKMRSAGVSSLDDVRNRFSAGATSWRVIPVDRGTRESKVRVSDDRRNPDAIENLRNEAKRLFGDQ